MGKYALSGAEEITLRRLYWQLKQEKRGSAGYVKAKEDIGKFALQLPRGGNTACAEYLGMHPTSFWITYVKPFR